ncbi:MAG: hypothetical protein ACI4NL_02460 [Christensenellales bacterium]
MKLRRTLSCMMALLLVCSLPVSALADTYDLAQGSVTVNATESGQTVTHKDTTKPDSAPVITQSNSSETSTSNTITITATENATANVTVKDVNIVISDPVDDPKDHSGEAAVTINVADGAEANVTLDSVKIDVGGTGGLTGDYIPGEAAVQITGNGDVTLELDGENTLQGGMHRAGVEKNTTYDSGKGELTITDENETQGSLRATGGEAGSGIGGGWGGSGSNITITGSAEVTAQGGLYGSGIGGGSGGTGSNITITGSAKVEASGDSGGSGIGGGWNGSGRDITISGSAEVTAKSGKSGSGIGGGEEGTGREITVSEDAQVKAQGGESEVIPTAPNATGAGAAIGDGGIYQHGTPNPEPLKGHEVAPNTDALNEGWIATYAPGTTDLDTATPDSLTYKNASGTVTTANQNIEIEDAQSATPDTHGHNAGFKVDNELVAVTTHNYDNYVSNNNATCTRNGTETGKCTVPNCSATHTRMAANSKLAHEFGDYVPDADNLATCTTAGTKTAQCKHCTATNTVTDPAKGHSFTNYIPNGNATYEKDGTKTAKCDHCDATHTIPDPGSKLVREAPLYRVLGQDGKALACKTARKDGVLTITVDADFASLTGTLGGIRTLKARGVDTIVFVTKGATSGFALSDLLAQGNFGDAYKLTHDGETVTFTLGKKKTNVTAILAKP